MVDEWATVGEFAQQNGLAFENPTLLRTALTHRSFLNEHPQLDWEDNERLEFLGDAVLDFLLAGYLFARFPGAPEGELTALRSALVRRSTLAGFARQLAVGLALFMGNGEADTGGRERDVTLCAAFEAVIGAYYLDAGLPAVQSFIVPLIERALSQAQAEVADKDPKSRLQELAQGQLGITPRYSTLKAEGPDHARQFTVQVHIGDMLCGEGTGPSKQVAAQQAAADALTHQATWAS